MNRSWFALAFIVLRVSNRESIDMYGSSYSSGSDFFSLIFAAGGAWVALSFIAFIAAIVCTVLLYKKYVAEAKTHQVAVSKRDFGPFLRFEKFWSEKILIALFIYHMCLIAFESAAAAISLLFAITYSIAGVFFGLLAIGLLFVLGEVLNRLIFEFFMLILKMWRNTQDIRDAVAPSTSQGAQPVSNPTANSASGAVPVSSKPMDDSWICPSCGASNKKGSFCAQCGSHR